MVDVDHAIEVLNRLHQADPTVMPTLITARVPCNDAVRDDPTIQVGVIADQNLVGILGILNGIFGIDEDGIGFIFANFDDKGNLVNFSNRPEQYCNRRK